MRWSPQHSQKRRAASEFVLRVRSNRAVDLGTLIYELDCLVAANEQRDCREHYPNTFDEAFRIKRADNSENQKEDGHLREQNVQSGTFARSASVAPIENGHDCKQGSQLSEPAEGMEGCV